MLAVQVLAAFRCEQFKAHRHTKCLLRSMPGCQAYDALSPGSRRQLFPLGHGTYAVHTCHGSPRLLFLLACSSHLPPALSTSLLFPLAPRQPPPALSTKANAWMPYSACPHCSLQRLPHCSAALAPTAAYGACPTALTACVHHNGRCLVTKSIRAMADAQGA